MFGNPFLTPEERYKEAELICEDKYRDLVSERINQFIGKSLIVHGLDVKNIKFNFSLRSTNISARAWTFERVIEINPILMLENEGDMIGQTVPHEVAHVVADNLHKKNCKHDRNWKRVMIDYGLPPEVCHNYDVSNSSTKTKKKRFLYKATCSCEKEKWLTEYLARRMLKGQIRICMICKTEIQIARPIQIK